ncbi:MAG: diacylglycerol kinase family protein [Spartobacteria bacterium]
MKRCIIVNPKAGSVKDLDGLLEKFRRLDPAAIHITAECGQAETHAREAAENGFDEIIIAGGDGTLNEIVNGVAPRLAEIRVGLIPLGTGNDFGRCLNLPEAVDDNIDIILAGLTSAVDVVRADSDHPRYFVNVSAGGFSGLVDEKLTPEMKKTWGPLAYLRSAAAALPELRSYRTTVELDAGENVDVDLYNVVIANGRFVAGGLPIAPEADPRDGLLDVVLVASRPAAEMAVLAAQIYVGKHLDSDAITFRRSKRVSVRSRPGMWFNVDGELVGNEPIVFEVMPKALQFLMKL